MGEYFEEINLEIRMINSVKKYFLILFIIFLAGCSVSNNKMDYSEIAKEIIALQNADLELRTKLLKAGQMNDGYNPEMEAMHNRNAERLDKIIDQIGYPTIDKVGKEANEATWLVIQHSIGKPEFMRKCAILLEKAVSENNANPKQLAYLTDRIAVFEGRPQLYGINFDYDENGELSPQLFDDIEKVNERRKKIGLNSLEERTREIRQQAIAENQKPPTDYAERTKQFNEWRKKVGWIK